MSTYFVAQMRVLIVMTKSYVVIAGICRLRLRHLDFSCNRIAHIPCDIRRLETLERLSLDNNPLLSPPAAVSPCCLSCAMG